MRRVFTINEKNVEFTSCTAISTGDTVRQTAVLVHDLDDEFHDGDGVIFGVDVPECVEDAVSIMEDYIDTDWETLKTFNPI